MVLIKKIKESIPTARAKEDTEAKLAKQQADIEFIAIMTDVELETPEELESEVIEND